MDIHVICIFVVMIQIIEIRVRRGRVRRFKMATQAVQPKNVMNEGPEEGPASVQKSPTQTLKKTIPTQTHQTILFGLVWQTCLWEPSKIGSAGRSGVYIYSVFDPMNSNKRFWGAVQKGDPEKGRSYKYMVFWHICERRIRQRVGRIYIWRASDSTDCLIQFITIRGKCAGPYTYIHT